MTTDLIKADLKTVRQLEGAPTSFKLAGFTLLNLSRGRLDVVLPDGRTLRFEGPEPGAHAVIIAKDLRFTRRVLSQGDIGFAEAYMADEFDTPDLTAILEFFSQNFEAAGRLAVGGWISRAMNKVRHILHRNSKSGSKKNILAHYDLGNQFYERWLDTTMTYSSATFEAPGQPLQDAQLSKYRRIAEGIALKPDAHVLEIGSGWGGFAEVAAKEFGAKVTSVTISNAQHEFASKRMFEAGLAERVDIQLRDYRDIDGKFD
ncbi:MAG: class I SAM-dependent methyltransferase, partial [Pseudomonadota bacterium]